MIKLETKELVKNLKNLAIVAGKVKIYPYLEYVKIYEKDDELIMEATNLEFLLRTHMRAEFDKNTEPWQTTSFAVHPKKLLDLLAVTKEKYVILEGNESSLTVKKESGAVIGTIAIMPVPDEFPSSPTEIGCVHKTTVFEGSADKFVAGMAAVLPSAAKDVYNQTLNSVRLSVFGSDKSEIENPESGWEWMATNAVTGSVCRARNPVSGESMDVLIPTDSAKILTKILGKNQDDISLGSYCVGTAPWLFGRAGNIEFGCSITIGQFPPLKKIFETPSVPWFSADGKEFAAALKSKSKEEKISLELQGGFLHIAGDDGGTSMVAVEENTSIENIIFMDPKKLLDLVNHKKVNININSHRGMVFIDVPSHPAGEFISIIMEIRNPKSKIQNPESKIRNPKSES